MTGHVSLRCVDCGNPWDFMPPGIPVCPACGSETARAITPPDLSGRGRADWAASWGSAGPDVESIDAFLRPDEMLVQVCTDCQTQERVTRLTWCGSCGGLNTYTFDPADDPIGPDELSSLAALDPPAPLWMRAANRVLGWFLRGPR